MKKILTIAILALSSITAMQAKNNVQCDALVNQIVAEMNASSAEEGMSVSVVGDAIVLTIAAPIGADEAAMMGAIPESTLIPIIKGAVLSQVENSPEILAIKEVMVSCDMTLAVNMVLGSKTISIPFTAADF